MVRGLGEVEHKRLSTDHRLYRLYRLLSHYSACWKRNKVLAASSLSFYQPPGSSPLRPPLTSTPLPHRIVHLRQALTVPDLPQFPCPPRPRSQMAPILNPLVTPSPFAVGCIRWAFARPRGTAFSWQPATSPAT